MSKTSHSPTASQPGDHLPRRESGEDPLRVGGPTTGQAVALLVIGLPLALVLTTFVTLKVLGWSPSYQASLSVATTVAVLAVTGVTFWMGVKIRRRKRPAGRRIMAASVFAAVTAIMLTGGLMGAGAGDVPPPSVINASSQTVIVLAGPDGNMHRWTTLSPGEHVDADPPFADGCFYGMWLEARTTDGRLLGTLFKPCMGEIWRITDTGTQRN